MWTKRQSIEHALAWHQQHMHDYDAQWRASGYRSTIAHNLYMKHRARAMALKTELRTLGD